MSADVQPYPGITYLRTLQRDRGTWWRLIVATLLGAIGLIAASVLAVVFVIVAARLLGFSDFGFDPDDGIDAGEMLATNLGLAAMIPLAGGLVWAVYGVRPLWVSSNRPRLRWGWLAACVGMAAVVWALLFALVLAGAIFERKSAVDSDVWWFMTVVIVTTPLQAAGEEYLFRGMLLQALGATRMPSWLCIGMSALLFATAHAQFDAPLFADRFALGVALAWLALRTGGLEAGIAIHAVKNLSVLIPAGLLEEVEDALDPQGVSWVPLIIDVVLLAIVMPWMLHLAKVWRRQGRLGPIDGAPLAPIPAGNPYGGVGGPWPPSPGWVGAAPPAGWQPPPTPPQGWPPPPPQGWPPPPPPQAPPPPPPPPHPAGWRPPPAGWAPPPQPQGWPPPTPPTPTQAPPQPDE